MVYLGLCRVGSGCGWCGVGTHAYTPLRDTGILVVCAPMQNQSPEPLQLQVELTAPDGIMTDASVAATGNGATQYTQLDAAAHSRTISPVPTIATSSLGTAAKTPSAGSDSVSLKKMPKGGLAISPASQPTSVTMDDGACSCDTSSLTCYVYDVVRSCTLGRLVCSMELMSRLSSTRHSRCCTCHCVCACNQSACV